MTTNPKKLFIPKNIKSKTYKLWKLLQHTIIKTILNVTIITHIIIILLNVVYY